jgi:hypothetical protein
VAEAPLFIDQIGHLVGWAEGTTFHQIQVNREEQATARTILGYGVFKSGSIGDDTHTRDHAAVDCVEDTRRDPLGEAKIICTDENAQSVAPNQN